MEKILNCYQYTGKYLTTTIADSILWPTRTGLGYKTISYDPKNKSFLVEDSKCRNIFFRIILILVAIVLLPISLVACLIKNCDRENAKVHGYFLEFLKPKQAGEEKKGATSEFSSAPFLPPKFTEPNGAPYIPPALNEVPKVHQTELSVSELVHLYKLSNPSEDVSISVQEIIKGNKGADLFRQKLPNLLDTLDKDFKAILSGEQKEIQSSEFHLTIEGSKIILLFSKEVSLPFSTGIYEGIIKGHLFSQFGHLIEAYTLQKKESDGPPSCVITLFEKASGAHPKQSFVDELLRLFRLSNPSEYASNKGVKAINAIKDIDTDSFQQDLNPLLELLDKNFKSIVSEEKNEIKWDAFRLNMKMKNGKNEISLVFGTLTSPFSEDIYQGIIRGHINHKFKLLIEKIETSQDMKSGSSVIITLDEKVRTYLDELVPTPTSSKHLQD